MTRPRFERLVAAAIARIPRRFRDAMRNVAVIVENEPPDELLDDLDVPEDETLFGLYQGTPLTERGWAQDALEPDRITVYQWPIEDACDTDEEIVRQIGETVIHEFGHYFGLDEDEIQAIEARYWRGEAEEA